MDSVGMVLSSEGRDLRVQVTSELVALGSILKIGDYYGIVAGMGYSDEDKIGSKQKLIAEVQVFGKLDGGRIRKIKRPVKPYEKVYLAAGQELEKILSVDDKISIGITSGCTKSKRLIHQSISSRIVPGVSVYFRDKCRINVCPIRSSGPT